MSTSAIPQFNRIRAILWPIKSRELKRFLPMLLINALICFNYSVLRLTKDSLVVTAPSSGAEAIPFIKVWAILPMALVSTYLFSKLSNRFPLDKIFYICMGTFLGFFFLFATVFYPLREYLHPNQFADWLQLHLPVGFKGFISIIRNWTFTMYYVMSELWSTVIMTVLFWGFANQITSVSEAKRYYGTLSVGANISSVFAGYFCGLLSMKATNLPFPFISDPWGRNLAMITSIVITAGLITMGIFYWYVNRIVPERVDKVRPLSEQSQVNGKKVKMSLRKNFSYLAQSKYLICIAVIVIAYNIAMNMIEIVWKDQIKLLYPNPSDYQSYTGKVSMVMGVVSIIIGLFFTSSLTRKFGWTFSALVTPIILLITGGLFFSFIMVNNMSTPGSMLLIGASPLALCVLMGSVHQIMSRACKYTLFDTTKEMSFIPLGAECKLKGKAAIDGVGSRLGKSGGSAFHTVLLMIFGTVSQSTPFVGIFLLAVIFGYMFAVKSLGKQFHELTSQGEKIHLDTSEEGKEGSEKASSPKEVLVQ